MKKVLSLITAAALLFVTGCNSADKETSPVTLANHMTQREMDATHKTGFQLLDKPWEQYMKQAEGNDYSYLNDKICLCEGTGAIVHGRPVFNALPAKDYDGGAGEVIYYAFDVATSESKPEMLAFDSFEDLKAKLRTKYDELIASGYQAVPANEEYDDTIALYEAVISGKVEMIGKDLIDEYMDEYYKSAGPTFSDSMYWEMDDATVATIKDYVTEYHMYDEELNLGFVVHVTTPPSYDSNRSYPAIVMTDAVWRFQNVPEMYDAMSRGEAEPQLMVTIGFEYDIDSWDNEVRAIIFCDHKKEYLDFITDNVMPYLSAEYKIDYGNSTLFGHSQGGVFSHYAAFNHDQYENKPFGRYIIASPAFWSPYFTDVSDYELYKTEYGYFDRNNSYDKSLLITAGDKEDADYEEYFGDNDSTLEGVEHFKERLDSHGVTSYQVKMYDSNHFKYVGQMLVEYCINFKVN